MQTPHPAIARAAALREKFFSHAPQAELSPRVQAEIAALDAQESDREYLDQLLTEEQELARQIAEIDGVLSDPEFNLSAQYTAQLESEREDLLASLSHLAHLESQNLMKHTPAPWFADIRRDPYPSKNIRQIVIEIGEDKACIAEVCGPFHPDVADANARLMAKSPELLDVLENLLLVIQSEGDSPDYEDALAHAIGMAQMVVCEAKGMVYDERTDSFIYPDPDCD